MGQITMGTGHADQRLNARGTVDHYDHTGTAIADVRVVDGMLGVWVSGAIRPTATQDQIETLRRASLSGDWRSVEGSLELVAALAVNVPGFAVARVAAGEPYALVAAGVVKPDETMVDIISLMATEIARLREQVDACLLYTSPSPRDRQRSRMPSSA